MEAPAATMTCKAEYGVTPYTHITIHSKFVPSPRRLSEILTAELGVGTYEVEMRHNIYDIRSRRGLDPDVINKIRELSRSLRVSI
ncbi:hypothetical protein F4677DRAFT_437816 [Hypoxylon crocopeplum]|nr:hypothetical protein F4677DRAFT_437816 [Hypoxylon crocopeplum]